MIEKATRAQMDEAHDWMDDNFPEADGLFYAKKFEQRLAEIAARDATKKAEDRTLQHPMPSN